MPGIYSCGQNFWHLTNIGSRNLIIKSEHKDYRSVVSKCKKRFRLIKTDNNEYSQIYVKVVRLFLKNAEMFLYSVEDI